MYKHSVVTECTYRQGGKLLDCRGKSPRDKLKHYPRFVRSNISRRTSLSRGDNKGGQCRIASDALLPARFPIKLLLCRDSCNVRGAGSLYIQSVLYRRGAVFSNSADRKGVMHHQ